MSRRFSSKAVLTFLARLMVTSCNHWLGPKPRAFLRSVRAAPELLAAALEGNFLACGWLQGSGLCMSDTHRRRLRYRCLVPDLRGFGLSRATAPPGEPNVFADDLRGLLDQSAN